jgi:hypothetical protein
MHIYADGNEGEYTLHVHTLLTAKMDTGSYG